MNENSRQSKDRWKRRGGRMSRRELRSPYKSSSIFLVFHQFLISIHITVSYGNNRSAKYWQVTAHCDGDALQDTTMSLRMYCNLQQKMAGHSANYDGLDNRQNKINEGVSLLFICQISDRSFGSSNDLIFFGPRSHANFFHSQEENQQST